MLEIKCFNQNKMHQQQIEWELLCEQANKDAALKKEQWLMQNSYHVKLVEKNADEITTTMANLLDKMALSDSLPDQEVDEDDNNEDE